MAKQAHRQGTGRRRFFLVAGIGLAVAILLAVGGIVIRDHDETALAKETDAAAIPSVDVIQPTHNAPNATLRLPGDVQAWYEAPIYAQVSGYLRMWYKDIGAPVKAGDLLAVIDAPEVDQQYRQAEARLAEAVANEKLAQVTAVRWQRLLVTNSVSRQSTDVATSDAVAKHALVLAAQADVDRVQALKDFERLVAPFDGVVTVRRTDVGAFIKGGGLPGPELFAVADIHAMRVYVRVPQSYAAQVHVGMDAELRLPEFPERLFKARVITTAHQVNEESRTMLVELEAPNPDRVLSPGSYATVEFQIKPDPRALILPVSALIFQEHGMQVATVTQDKVARDNKVVLKQIRIGRDDGTEVEVVGGIDPHDEIIDNPPDSITAGETVHIGAHRGAPPNGTAGSSPEPGQ